MKAIFITDDGVFTGETNYQIVERLRRSTEFTGYCAPFIDWYIERVKADHPGIIIDAPATTALEHRCRILLGKLVNLGLAERRVSLEPAP